MMTERDVYDEFEVLWNRYAVCAAAANDIASPNPEDDAFIKMAILGFSCHDKTENWQQGHYKVVKDYLTECEKLGDSTNAKRFNMLALGSLLGLHSSGTIDERVYQLGYILLPGFVMGKGGSIDQIGTEDAS